MAFWLVLSLPPLVIAVSSIATLVIGEDAALPAEGGLIRDLVARQISLISLGGLTSLVFLLFSGSRVLSSLVNAIYVMWRHVGRAGTTSGRWSTSWPPGCFRS